MNNGNIIERTHGPTAVKKQSQGGSKAILLYVDSVAFTECPVSPSITVAVDSGCLSWSPDANNLKSKNTSLCSSRLPTRVGTWGLSAGACGFFVQC